tara:strand:+ start:155 stop:349 length:195 start_codon:yes stop_codon:yes gene_type:complete
MVSKCVRIICLRKNEGCDVIMTEINCRDDYTFRELERKVERLESELKKLHSIVNGIRDNGASSL